jgi:uncharacterized short protein YbdD (DUF466 family)
MGLFDVFKSPEEKKMEELMRKMQQQIFPGGNTQMEKEINDVRALLNFKYSKEDIKQTYVHAAAMYFIADDKSPQSIITSILHNKTSVVTKEDALKIVQYLQKRFNTNPLETLVKKATSGMSDGAMLFMVAKGGIVELKKAYKDLSDKGKFEVIICNSLTALRVYQQNHPDKYEKTEEDFFQELFKQAKTYQINDDPYKLMDFINSRFAFYSQEINSIYSNTAYIPGKIYTAFYISPFIKDPGQNLDLGEIMMFFGGLTKMLKWVNENSKKV